MTTEYLDTKATKINNKYHCRLIDTRTDSVIHEIACDEREDVGFCMKYMLRWHDKMGGSSKMADKSRDRTNSKEPKGAVGRIYYHENGRK